MALEHGHLTAFILPTLDLYHRKHHFYNLVCLISPLSTIFFFSRPLYFRTQAFGAKKRSKRSSPFLLQSRPSSITPRHFFNFQLQLTGNAEYGWSKNESPSTAIDLPAKPFTFRLHHEAILQRHIHIIPCHYPTIPSLTFLSFKALAGSPSKILRILSSRVCFILPFSPPLTILTTLFSFLVT